MALQHVRPQFQSLTIAREAVRQNAHALQHVSSEIEDYAEVAAVAVRQNGHALRYVQECMGGREDSFLMREPEHLWLSKPFTDFGQDGVNFSEQTPDRVLYAYMTA